VPKICFFLPVHFVSFLPLFWTPRALLDSAEIYILCCKTDLDHEGVESWQKMMQLRGKIAKFMTKAKFSTEAIIYLLYFSGEILQIFFPVRVKFYSGGWAYVIFFFFICDAVLFCHFFNRIVGRILCFSLLMMSEKLFTLKQAESEQKRF